MTAIELVPYPRSIQVDPSGKQVRATVNNVVMDDSLPSQGYRIIAEEAGVTLMAADEDGLRYAEVTLEQLIRLSELSHPRGSEAGSRSDSCIPACRITDWPDFLVRSVMLDISRTKIPTLESMDYIIELLARLKFNQLHLYMEHTFAYIGHDEVWEYADPYTAGDIEHIKATCRQYGIDLVPHQNTLGHMERWLTHERYRQLAIKPDGFYWLFGIERKPTTIDPDKPESFLLISQLLQQLLPLFDSPYVHVGMDEPWELSGERSHQWVEWLKRLKGIDQLKNRHVMVWGDYLNSHPKLIDELPDDITVCEWGYDSGHPFGSHLESLSSRGITTYTCCGTSSWLSLTSRVNNALSNISQAVQAGIDYGSKGLMICDWGDMGHHQQLPFMFPSLVAAAALSWSYNDNRSIDLSRLGRLTGIHMFSSSCPEIGEALVSLGQVHDMVVPKPPNMSALVLHLLLPQFPVGSGLTTGLTIEDLERVAVSVDESVALCNSCDCSVGDDRIENNVWGMDYIVDEIRAGADWLKFAIKDAGFRLEHDGSLSSVSSAKRNELISELAQIQEVHRLLWLRRNRNGGLDESSKWLEHLADCYRSGSTDPKWFGPLG